MQEADLVRMSTQIAAFFAAYPDAEAIPGIAEHLRNFWAPSMRDQLFAMHEAGTPPLHPLVGRAITILRAAEPTA
jgi:formate dehydrogenase subunit delta